LEQSASCAQNCFFGHTLALLVVALLLEVVVVAALLLLLKVLVLIQLLAVVVLRPLGVAVETRTGFTSASKPQFCSATLSFGQSSAEPSSLLGQAHRFPA
jgi:hypothetical protein